MSINIIYIIRSYNDFNLFTFQRYITGVTCIVCNVLLCWSKEQKNKRTNNRTMLPTLKKQYNCRLSGTSENRAFERWRSIDITNSQNDQLPVGLIPQLEAHCTGIPEVMGLNLIQVHNCGGPTCIKTSTTPDELGGQAIMVYQISVNL